MFPSLKNIETARLARNAILQSTISFSGWDLKKALRYLYIVGGPKFLKRVGLKRVSPRWLGDREDLLTVGGVKSKGDECWEDSEKEIFEHEERKIIAYMMEAMIDVVMSTHVYKFGNKYFLQHQGGPIGLRSTASLASLTMKI